MAVSLQLLHGDIEQIRREYSSVFSHGVSITRKLGFSNIIMPGKCSARTTWCSTGILSVSDIRKTVSNFEVFEWAVLES